MSRGPAIFATLALGLLAMTCQTSNTGWSRAYIIDDLTQVIGGPKAGATLGDIRIENDKIRVVVNGRAVDIAAGGVQRWGGYIMDADIQRGAERPDQAPRGEDRLVQLVPAFDIRTAGFKAIKDDLLYRTAADAIEIVNDGRDGGVAEVLVRGELHNILPIMQVLPVVHTIKPIVVETRYRLEPGANYIEIISDYIVGIGEGELPKTIYDLPVQPLRASDSPALAATSADSLGDWFFAGASLDMFGPGVFGFASASYVETQWRAGKTTVEKPLVIDWAGAIGDGIGYALVVSDAPLLFPLIEGDFTYAFGYTNTDTTLFDRPGARLRYRRYLVVDDGDVAGLWPHVLKLKDRPSGRLEGRLRDAITGEPVSGQQVVVFERPRFRQSGALVPLAMSYQETQSMLAAQPASVVTANRLTPISRFSSDSRYNDRLPDGSFGGDLPPGDYVVMALGPVNAMGDLLPVTIKADQTVKIELATPDYGYLEFEVVSSGPFGPHEPVKLTLQGHGGVGVADPYLGQSYLPAGISEIVHARYGRGRVRLPPGVYDISAGRGYEYSVWRHAVKIEAGQTVFVRGEIDRVVDTGGWIAADTHIHSQRSPDASPAEQDRVLGALVEGMEYVVNTEHDVISNYHPAAVALEARGMLHIATGLELSQIWGHFISFPISYDASKPYGGRINWGNPSPSKNLPEYTPQDIFDALRANVDRERLKQDGFVIVNHSQDSPTGYLRSFGFGQMSGQFGETELVHAFNPIVNNGGLIAPSGEPNFSWDFQGMDVLNGGSVNDYRTATTEEVATPTTDNPKPEPKPFLPTIIRTWDEQQRISNGQLKLVKGERGLLEDYMTLLTQGRRITGLGVSDSHSKRKEIGKMRSYVYTGSDDPATLTDDLVTDGLKAGRVIAMAGPFVEAWINDQPIGSEVEAKDQRADLRIRVQAAEWVAVDRVEIYGNGVLIGEIGSDSGNVALPCDGREFALAKARQIVRLDATLPCSFERDSVITVVAMGYSGLSPDITPEDAPGIDSQNLSESLGQILQAWLEFDAAVLPVTQIDNSHEIYPYGIANAIWVDVDGKDRDGDGYLYDGPGSIPGMFDEDEEEDNSNKRKLGADITRQLQKWLKRQPYK